MMTRSNRLIFLIALFILGGLAGCDTTETQCIWDNGEVQCFVVAPYLFNNLQATNLLINMIVILPWVLFWGFFIYVVIIPPLVKIYDKNYQQKIEFKHLVILCAFNLIILLLVSLYSIYLDKINYKYKDMRDKNLKYNWMKYKNEKDVISISEFNKKKASHKNWQIKSNLYLIFESNYKANSAISDLNKYRYSKLLPLHKKNLAEYKQHYNDVRQRLPRLGLYSHQDLLRNRERYREEINLLERTAILRHSVNWLEAKLAKVNAQISDLEQNVWKMEKKLELSTVASPEEQAQVEKIINSTKLILEENITPPEAQDIGKLEQTIFDEIMGRR